MKINLHLFVFILLFILPFSFLKAQVERVSSVKLKQAPSVQELNSPVILTDKSKIKQEIKKDNFQANFLDSSVDRTIIEQSDYASKSSDKIQFSDNVTYEKESLPETEKIVSAERKMTKVLPSVNYKPRVIKEDIHPVIDYSNAGISNGKRVYIQQDADDLQREIDQNSTNQNYDLAKKQKQLDEIKKMLQN